jgi:hypothetical protein
LENMSDSQLSFRKSANIDHVTDKRKDSLFRLVDTDGSGSIDAQEFAVLYDAIKKDLAEELEKEAALEKEASSARRRFKMLLLFVAVLVSFLAASVAANFAVIFTVVDEAITTTTSSSGLLEVKGSDMVAKTAIATQDVPLVVAPALDLETLSNVKSLKLTYNDFSNVVETQLFVVGVRKHNVTFVEFITNVAGETVEVLNGVASLVRYPTDAQGQRPSRFNICSANATCSAFRASGIDADAALDQARADLEASGFGDAARRLQSTPTGGCPTGGNWYAVVCTGAAGTTCVPQAPSGMSEVSSYLYLYHTGYTGTRHVVFLLHGMGQDKEDMWDYHCSPTSAPIADGFTSCSDITAPGLGNDFFFHLVFIFPTSGISGNAWQTDLLVSETFYNGADSIASIMCGYGTHGMAWDGCAWNRGSLQIPGVTQTSGSEIMLFGYSNGGGLALYANYGWSYMGVSKSVVIDFHTHHTPEWIAASAYDGYSLNNFRTTIYYSCASTWYWTGQITAGSTSSFGSSSGATFVGEASLSTGPSYTAVGVWKQWTWTGAGGKYLKLKIQGLAAGTTTAPTCDCTLGWDGPMSCLGMTCTGEPTGGCSSASHSAMATQVSLYDEVCDWVGGCTQDSPPPSPPPPVSTPSWGGHTCKNPDMPSDYCCPPGSWCTQRIHTKKHTGFLYSLHCPDCPWYCVTGGDMIMEPIPASGIHAKLGMCPQDYWGHWHREADKSDFKQIQERPVPHPEELTKEETQALEWYLTRDRKREIGSRAAAIEREARVLPGNPPEGITKRDTFAFQVTMSQDPYSVKEPRPTSASIFSGVKK